MKVPDNGFDVAISFAGEDREIAEALANRLVSLGVSVFYDRFFQSDLWGKDLYEHISDIYTNRSKFCVILVSAQYLLKKWTRHERKSAQARAFTQGPEYILPVRLDDSDLPGLASTVGYLDLRERSINDISDFILEKLGFMSESELRRRRALIEERASTVGILPDDLQSTINRLVQEHDLVIGGSSEPQRWPGKSVCNLCNAIYRNDNLYFCVDCQKAYCHLCVWKLDAVPFKETEFRWYCSCRGRVG